MTVINIQGEAPQASHESKPVGQVLSLAGIRLNGPTQVKAIEGREAC